jgi:hypothetical protein
MPARYYEYLFNLRDARAINSLGDQIRTWRHSQWVAYMAGNDPLTVSVEGEDVEEDPEDGVAGAGEPCLPPPPAPPLINVEQIVERTEMGRGGRPFLFCSPTEFGNVYIRFYGRSHQTGNLRMYVNCRYHQDEGCVKYKFVRHYESEHDCASWLAGWFLSGANTGSRLEHRDTPVPDQLVSDAFVYVRRP